MHDKIGILCAGDREVAPILARLEDDAPSQKAMLTFHVGLNAFEQNCAQASQLAARFTQALLQAWRRL